MRRAQRALSAFLPLVDWPRFRRRPLAGEATVSDPAVHLFACGDDAQAVLYLLRTDTIGPDGMLRTDAAPLAPRVTIPDIVPGTYRAVTWDTRAGRPLAARELDHTGGTLTLPLAGLVSDMAVAVRRTA
jgi:mannan endo-1,4-beta-mannosidase